MTINYDPSATVPARASPRLSAAPTRSADNYYPAANTDDGSCFIVGCTDSTRLNFDAAANFDSGLCTPWFYGCTIAAIEGVAATNFKRRVHQGRRLVLLPRLHGPRQRQLQGLLHVR